VREDKDGVTLGDETFTATFGFKTLETPISNLGEAHITRNYHWFKAVGMRLSFADDGLTFGTATEGGVCVHFKEKVPRVFGPKDHSALTVTVADLDGLAKAISAL